MTSTAERARNLITANQMATGGDGSRIFLFADIESACSRPILELPLVNGKGEITRLVD